MENNQPGFGEELEVKERQEVGTPSMYRVFLLNDDYTTMEFVVQILEKVFHKRPAEAVRIMFSVHRNGKGLAGVYTREIAETKMAVVHETALKNNFPLKCAMEKE